MSSSLPVRNPVVVVGAGVAGVSAVEAMRARGYDGPLVLLDADPHPPYDRPPLSKSGLSRDGGPTPLRPDDVWTRLAVDRRLGVRAVAVDPERHVVRTDAGAFPYDRLLLATGGIARWPRRLPRIEGALTLRTADDAARLRDALVPGARLVVVGAGLIGTEVAASARALGVDVTIVDPLAQPLAAAVGRAAAEELLGRHRAEGVRLLLGRQVAALHGGERVRSVELDDGTSLPADVVLVAVGGAAGSAWLRGSGLELAEPAPDAGVRCDPNLQAGPDVWVAGDLAVPDGLGRSEHWMAAVEQAEVAAANLLGQDPPVAWEPAPYFWTDQYDIKVQVVGVPPGHDPCLTESSPDGRRRLQVWADADGRAVAAVTVNWPAWAMAWRERVRVQERVAEPIAAATA